MPHLQTGATDGSSSPRHRAAIDALDREILRALNARARTRRRSARCKEGSAAYRPEREAQVLRATRRRQCAGRCPNAAVTGVFREIMSACLALGADAAHCLSGSRRHVQPRGRREAFRRVRRQPMPLPTIDEIFRAVESGQTDYAVVPVENSTEGAVGSHARSHVHDRPVRSCGEVKLRVAAESAVQRGALDRA